MGKRILVTRPRAQAAELADKLIACSAVPILFPTIEIAPLEDYTALDNAIRLISQYRWLIFTSVNGVAAFWSRLRAASVDERSLAETRIAAIGPATAKAVAHHGHLASLIPDEYIAEAIVPSLGEVRGHWILLPRAEIAREALVVELERQGAVVHEIAAYRTLPAVPNPNGFIELKRGVDAITFTSSSTVRNFIELINNYPVNLLNPLTLIACIGPITTQTAHELGLRVDVVAREYTTHGLVTALLDYYAHLQSPVSDR